LLGKSGADPHVSANEEVVVESRFSVDGEAGKGRNSSFSFVLG
jgi:hypothetical protein